MNYKAYQHIEKIGKSEVDGILDGTCYITYKIDGTNACVWLGDDGELHYGSRNREITVDKDNAGFARYVSTSGELHDELKSLLEEHKGWVIYGEWLVPVSIKTYREDAKKKFYAFDVFDGERLEYVNFDEWTKIIDDKYQAIGYIPLLAKLENPTIDDLKALLDRTGEYLVTQGKGEGIVIKNYGNRNIYGRETWGKMLTEDFAADKHDGRKANHEAKAGDNAVEYKVANLLTTEHIGKEWSKLLENKGTGWDDRYTFELMNRVFSEFIGDNMEIILKKFHNPTINFMALRRMCDAKVREYIQNNGI